MRKPNKQRTYIASWLTRLRDEGRLRSPVHRMNINAWYDAYIKENKHISSAEILDIKYFNLQMNKVASYSLFEGKIVNF